MTRKLIQFAIIFLASLTMLACSKVANASPNEVLSNYLDALSKGKYEELYSYVSADDKAVKDLQSYLKEHEDNFEQAMVYIMASRISYKILKIEKSDKKATANVEWTEPDLRSIFFDVIGVAFSGGDEKEMEKTLAKKFKSGEIPLMTRKETFKLVKEEGDWKIFLDWKTEKIKEERQAKIRALLAEAKDLKKSMKLHGAAQKYEQVLELDSEMTDAKKRLEETKKEINLFEEKQTYIKNVVLYDLKAKYYNKTYSKGVPAHIKNVLQTYSEGGAGVEFKIKNKGDRTLKEVEVTVYFKNASGTIIAEEVYHPVLVTRYNKLLKPNYIWQKRGEYYKADSVPSEWKEGAVSAKITNIEFEE